MAATPHRRMRAERRVTSMHIKTHSSRRPDAAGLRVIRPGDRAATATATATVAVNAVAVLAAVMAAALCAPSALAQVTDIERRFALGIGAEYSDNIGRVDSDSDPQSLTYGNVDLDVGLSREGQRLSAFVDGNLTYHRYDSDDYDNETLGDLSAGLTIRAVPDIFSWDVANRIGHVRRDPFSAAEPGNRERLNVFSTGPDFRAPLAPRLAMQISARYTEREWQRSDELDSTVHSAELGLLRALDPRRHVAVTAAGRRVSFDSPLAPEYEVHLGYITYASSLPNNELELSIGASRLRREGESQTGTYLSASWLRLLTTRSRLELRLSRDFEDAGDELLDVAVLPGGTGVGDVATSSDPMTRSRFGFTYSLTRPRTTYTAGTDWSRERFVSDTGLDRDGWRSSIGARHQFSRGTAAELALFYGRERFTALDDSIAERGVTAGLLRRLSRTWNMVFRHEYVSRDANLFGDFSENRYRLSFVWTPVI